MTCLCKVGPGKFEGEGALTFIVREWALQGGGDETTGGDGFGTPCVEWFRAPVANGMAWDTAAIQQARDYGFCEPCILRAMDQATRIKGGVAYYESDQGFAYSVVYDTKREFDAALKEAYREDDEAQEEIDAAEEAQHEADEGRPLDPRGAFTDNPEVPDDTPEMLLKFGNEGGRCICDPGKADIVTCNACGFAWCDTCNPAPSARCWNEEAHEGGGEGA